MPPARWDSMPFARAWQDALWATLTVRDHLNLAFDLYQPSLSRDARDAAVAALIASVGLAGHEDTKARPRPRAPAPALASAPASASARRRTLV